MKPTESLSKASLNFINKFNVFRCWRPIKDTIVLCNWTHTNAEGAEEESHVADVKDSKIQDTIDHDAAD